MSELYNNIEILCKQKHISITTMCKESGVSRGSLTDLKSGRSRLLSSEALSKIAKYFGVDVSWLMGLDVSCNLTTKTQKIDTQNPKSQQNISA